MIQTHYVKKNANELMANASSDVSLRKTWKSSSFKVFFLLKHVNKQQVEHWVVKILFSNDLLCSTIIIASRICVL